jgi:hypothetical protein
MQNTPPPAKSASEQEQLLAELVALDRQGKATPGRLAALDARIQKSIDEDDRRLAERIAEIKRHRAKAGAVQQLSRGQLFVLMALFIYLLLGVVLELQLGGSFVFAFTSQ